MILAALAAYFVNGWIEPFTGISLRSMITLIVFIAAYMTSSRYLKNLRD